MYSRTIVIETRKYSEYDVITKDVEKISEESGITNGIVTVLSMHTTAGITVNESLECLESDIDVMLKRLIPEDYPYSHARLLPEYGSTAGNPTGHLKALLTGNHCHMLLKNGKLKRGGAQEIYFCEFDGPSKRTIQVIVTAG
jgi:secondary thiamine-phosphate synthase enzyme